MASTILLEVVDQGLTMVSKITEVYGLSSGSEKEQTIEYSKQLGGRLMNPEIQRLIICDSLTGYVNTYVQRIACPLSARFLKKAMMAQAL